MVHRVFSLFLFFWLSLVANVEIFISPKLHEIDFEYETLAKIEKHKLKQSIYLPAPLLKPLTKNTMLQTLFAPAKKRKQKRQTHNTTIDDKKKPLHIIYYLPRRYANIIQKRYEDHELVTKVFVSKESSIFYEIREHYSDFEINPHTHLFKMEALTYPGDLNLCAGQIVFAHLFIEKRHILTIDDSTLFTEKGQHFVWKKTPSGIEKTPIKIMKSYKNYNVVLSGLTIDDQLLSIHEYHQ